MNDLGWKKAQGLSYGTEMIQNCSFPSKTPKTQRPEVNNNEEGFWVEQSPQHAGGISIKTTLDGTIILSYPPHTHTHTGEATISSKSQILPFSPIFTWDDLNGKSSEAVWEKTKEL